MKMNMNELDKYVTSIPDFPEPGIIFRDVTTICGDADGLKLAVDGLQAAAEDCDCDVIVGCEARGFIFGMPVAYNMHKPFVPVRKKGKLPRETICEEYLLEYGTAEIEVHKDCVKPGQKVVIVDDLIATGGTVEAGIKLFEKLGAEVVKCIFLIDLPELGGRKRLANYNVETVLSFEGE